MIYLTHSLAFARCQLLGDVFGAEQHKAVAAAAAAGAAAAQQHSYSSIYI